MEKKVLSIDFTLDYEAFNKSFSKEETPAVAGIETWVINNCTSSEDAAKLFEQLFFHVQLKTFHNVKVIRVHVHVQENLKPIKLRLQNFEAKKRLLITLECSEDSSKKIIYLLHEDYEEFFVLNLVENHSKALTSFVADIMIRNIKDVDYSEFDIKSLL
jgi:hypothetical protein